MSELDRFYDPIDDIKIAMMTTHVNRLSRIVSDDAQDGRQYGQPHL